MHANGGSNNRAGRIGRLSAIHLSSGHIVMIVAGALGVALTLSLLRAADRTVPVVAAARELRAGAALETGDLTVTRLRADDAVMATLFRAEDLRRLNGRVLTTAAAAGAPLIRSAVRPAGRADARRTMSFPLPRARALGGRLGPGDRVDVVAVDREARRAEYAVTGAEVVAVDGTDNGALGGGADEITITLTVTPPVATRIAGALDVGSVTLVRSTGAAPVAVDPAAPAIEATP
ncbi:MAG: RcpC/CpaB family pilus assembly protein [Actinomycetota bacterium]